MRVKCIDDRWIGPSEIGRPIFLEDYNVVEAFSDEDGEWFELAEFPPIDLGGGMWKYNSYEQKGFAILSDKSADEINQEACEAIVNIETPINS